ncbi:MAG: hypothetical protein KGH94_05310 [Candidatus Micrarchaeota archaeon]|nr:hypothetical protein [Candidatus Micrarchaeota archaeon]
MFMDTISRYMASRYVRFGDGEIWFGDLRCTFNFIPILAREFIINNELDPERYSSIVFLAAKRAGYDFVTKHAIPLVKNWTPVIGIGIEWLSLYGHGLFRSVKADRENGFLLLSGRSNIGQEIKGQKPSTDPTDFTLGGLMAGTMEYYTKKPTYAVEISCVAQKDVQECVIVAGERKTIKSYIEKFAPEKMEWADKSLDRIEAVEKELGEGWFREEPA